MKSYNIAVIGECMVELQKTSIGIQQSFGGDTLNTCLYLSRLTKDTNIQCSYVTGLGEDGFSRQMLDAWRTENINTELVMTHSDKQPGLYYIETDDAGERSFVYWRSDSAAKYLFDREGTETLIKKLMAFDAVYLSGITLAILTAPGRKALFSFLSEFKNKGGKVIFDNNYRPRLWESQIKASYCYQKMLSYTDIALLTFDDEQALFGDENVEQCVERTTEAGVYEIIIKRGSQDCLVIEGQDAQFVPANRINHVVDTTAAGDSFSAGYLAKRLLNGSAVESARLGHLLAGRVIQHSGAIIPVKHMPTI